MTLALDRERRPVRLAVWGLGRVFRRRLEAVLRLRDTGQALLVAAVDSASQVPASVEGVPVVPPEALVGCDPDLVIVMSTPYLDEIVERAVALGVPRERLVGHDILDVPDLDLDDYVRLRRAVPSIVSNDGWGASACRTLQVPCRSPFCEVTVAEGDYLRMLLDLPRYLSVETPSYRGVRVAWDGTAYHSCLLDDVEVRLLATRGFEEAWEAWRAGCSLVDWDNLLVEMSTCDPAAERAFHEAVGDARGICLVPFEAHGPCSRRLLLAEGQSSFAPVVGSSATGQGLPNLAGLVLRGAGPAHHNDQFAASDGGPRAIEPLEGKSQ